MKDLETILKKLKEKGCRFTKIRESVLDFLIGSSKPLSIADIEKKMESENIAANKATLYRELAFLKDEKIVRELNFAGKARYYEIVPDKRHCHFVCVRCHGVQCIDLDGDPAAAGEGIAEAENFKILDQSLDFFGLCSKCR